MNELPKESQDNVANALFGNVNFHNDLIKLGFKNIGSGWFENEFHDIRIRIWKGCEVDFWLWRSSEDTDDNQIHFRGKIYSIDDVKWVLERCFNIF